MSATFQTTRRFRERGFTLVEIALALGIAAFALVGIIGMVPVALDNARESRQQTHAAFIARTIFGNLFSGADGKAMVQVSESGSDSDFELVALEPELARSFTLAFDEAGRLVDPEGAGTPREALFTAQLTLTKTDEKPARAEVSVETPPGAAKANRQAYQFVSQVFR